MPLNLQIKSMVGTSERALGLHNAYLGVSFSKTTYFSRPVMESYVRWVASHCRDLLIIVADHLEAHNAVVFRGLSLAEAEERTRRTGIDLQRGYERAVPNSLQHRVRVRLASDIVAEPECQATLKLVRAVAESNARFAEDLRSTVLFALGGKFQSLEASPAEQERNLDILTNYIIEEIAIILYITGAADRRYDLSVFPYKPPRILVDLFAGRYGTDVFAYTEGRPYAAMELVAAEQKELAAVS